jgi:hypothetical protein
LDAYCVHHAPLIWMLHSLFWTACLWC